MSIDHRITEIEEQRNKVICTLNTLDGMRLSGADGAYRWFLTRVNAVRDRHGHVMRWFGTNTDITPRKEAEAAFNRILDRVDAGDIKTPKDLEKVIDALRAKKNLADQVTGDNFVKWI